MKRCVAVAICALGVMTVGQAEESVLTLDQAAQLAIQGQPGLEAYEHAALAAREASVAEGELPDPLVSIGAQNVPITGSDQFRLDRDDMTMATVGVMQEMVRPEKRRAAADRMRAESEQWMLERAALAREVVRDAKLAWIDVYEATRQAASYRDLGTELNAERQVASQQISSGAAGLAEVFRLDGMLAAVNDRRITAAYKAERARARLARWLGDAAFRPLPAELQANDAAMARPVAAASSIADHPQLVAQRKAIDVARFEADRARAERKANWSWQLMYGYRQDDRSDMISLQFAMPLQLDRAQRQDRRVAEKLALVERVRAMTLDRERELRAELLAVRSDMEAVDMRLREHGDRLMPAAQARLRTVSAAYEAGTQRLSALWEARREVLEAELHGYEIESEMLRAKVRYDYLVGETQ